MSYRPTIGLEIHVELATETKMFCKCKNDPDAGEPNIHVCPVCMAHPGTLPVPNAKAIEQVFRVGAAVGSTLADYSEFDRKSYFYPDIPKGYQISQYEYPFVTGGELAGVAITRIHLEEDTARSSHESENESLLDFNRAGVPLMELVTEPAIHDAETASVFARELQLLLRTLGVSHANLEKGEMRLEANISISDSNVLGTKVEVKNLNSFRSLERAIAYELKRHEEVLTCGGSLTQETRGWDENKQITFSQRLKEGSADYRYFPEPDIPKIKRSEVAAWSEEALKAALPELPEARRSRYKGLGIKQADVEYIIQDTDRSAFFDDVLSALPNTSSYSLAANYFVSDLAGLMASSNSFGNVTPESFACLISLAASRELSSRGVKDTLSTLYLEGGEPRTVADKLGLIQVNDFAFLKEIVRSVIKDQPAAVTEYKSGKEAILQFLVGQCMKMSKGAGNPTILKQLLLSEIGDS